MKTLFFTLIMLTTCLFADSANTEWVDKQVQAIKPPRSGVSHTAINRIKSPFLYVYKKSTSAGTVSKDGTTPQSASSQAKPLQLAAVMNNSALINGTWYQISDKVRGYSIEKIETDSVLLMSGKTKKMLFITQDNPKIKIQIK